MSGILRNPFKFVLTLVLSFSMAVISGCASGGFKLTRSYAQFVNKQNIFLRIILYILTSVVFAVTMLIDMVVFNTMDFWEGRVSAGDYQFAEGEKTYFVQHRILPEGSLKQSKIQVFSSAKKLLQTVELAETKNGEIELRVDGVLRTQVKDISSLPIASFYSAKGSFIEDKIVLAETALPVLAHR